MGHTGFPLPKVMQGARVKGLGSACFLPGMFSFVRSFKHGTPNPKPETLGTSSLDLEKKCHKKPKSKLYALKPQTKNPKSFYTPRDFQEEAERAARAEARMEANVMLGQMGILGVFTIAHVGPDGRFDVRNLPYSQPSKWIFQVPRLRPFLEGFLNSPGNARPPSFSTLPKLWPEAT